MRVPVLQQRAEMPERAPREAGSLDRARAPPAVLTALWGPAPLPPASPLPSVTPASSQACSLPSLSLIPSLPLQLTQRRRCTCPHVSVGLKGQSRSQAKCSALECEYGGEQSDHMLPVPPPNTPSLPASPTRRGRLLGRGPADFSRKGCWVALPQPRPATYLKGTP